MFTEDFQAAMVKVQEAVKDLSLQDHAYVAMATSSDLLGRIWEEVGPEDAKRTLAELIDALQHRIAMFDKTAKGHFDG